RREEPEQGGHVPGGQGPRRLRRPHPPAQLDPGRQEARPRPRSRPDGTRRLRDPHRPEEDLLAEREPHSTIYDVPMPYGQFFDGGQAFQSVGVSMWNPPGSHGCVNMTENDAKKYWSLLKNGDEVYVYGRKPGT